MPRPNNFRPSVPPLGQNRCPKCGVPMFMSQIDPSDKPDYDVRTFECQRCDYSETITVQFR